MPTTWYFRNTNAPAGPTGELSTDTDSFPTVPSDKNTPKDMIATKGTGQVEVLGAYIAASKYTMARLFVGPALAAQTLTGGQAGYKVGTGSKESATSANKYQRTFVYVWRSGSGNVKTIIVPTSCGTEHTTTEKGCVITVAGAAGDFSVLENDRIVVEIWFDIRDSTTSYTSYLYYDGTTDAVEATTNTNVAGFFYCPQTLNLPVTVRSFSDVASGSDAFSNPFRAMPFGETGHGTEAFNNPFRAMPFADAGVGQDAFTNPFRSMGFSDVASGADAFITEILVQIIEKYFADSSLGSDSFINPYRAMGFLDTGLGTDVFGLLCELAFSDFGGGSDAFVKEIMEIILKSFIDGGLGTDVFAGVAGVGAGVGAGVAAPAVPDVGAPQKKKPKPKPKWLQPARDYLQWKVSA